MKLWWGEDEAPPNHIWFPKVILLIGSMNIKAELRRSYCSTTQNQVNLDDHRHDMVLHLIASGVFIHVMLSWFFQQFCYPFQSSHYPARVKTEVNREKVFGRFSNGKTTVDVIAELLGFEDYITPYVAARGQDILRGVNYASAAAGIREETGRQLGGRITFAGQVSYHVNTVARVVNILGDESKAANYLSKCIYSIGLGSNDYLNNYFMPLYYSTGNQFSPDQYADDLISRYADQLRILYNNGARKFVLVGIGAIGCSPNELAQRSQDGRTCDERINEANRMFNARLISLVDQFNQKTPDAKFTYINAYGVFQDIVNNPARYGFGVTNAGCCGVGRNNGQITCLPGQAPCLNRNEFVFWDAFHPGEAANIIIGRRSFRAESPNDAHPYDIEHLAML